MSKFAKEGSILFTSTAFVVFLAVLFVYAVLAVISEIISRRSDGLSGEVLATVAYIVGMLSPAVLVLGLIIERGVK
jgi:hypothetical protein